jgi:microcystin-dependent protein
MNIKDIILFILVIVIIYLVYKTKNLEKFDDLTDRIKITVRGKYNMDIDAIRNLASISKNILRDANTLILPINKFNINNLTLNYLEVNGNVKFNSKNTTILNIFPKYMIIPWASNITISNIPKGWALCDGKKYILNTFTLVAELNDNGTLTPNLSSRFILGAGKGDGLIDRVFDNIGGEENVTLTIAQIPSHNHSHHQIDIAQSGTGEGNHYSSKSQKIHGPGITGSAGSNAPHNNMPPFNALFYIMKL